MVQGKAGRRLQFDARKVSARSVTAASRARSTFTPRPGACGTDTVESGLSSKSGGVPGTEHLFVQIRINGRWHVPLSIHYFPGVKGQEAGEVHTAIDPVC